MSDRNLDLAQKIIDLALSLGADSADAVVGESASLNVSCRLGQLEDTERSESRELGLRAISASNRLSCQARRWTPKPCNASPSALSKWRRQRRPTAIAALHPPSVWQQIAEPRSRR